MKSIRQYIAVLAALMLMLAPMSFANTASNTVTVPVLLSIPESVSLTTTSTGIVLTNAAPSSTITLTASWQLLSGHTSATVYSWFSALPTASGTTLPSSDFSTSFQGGSTVVCTQNAFPQGTFGVSGQNCGTYALTQNVASDLNDSVPVSLTLTASAATFAATPNNYQGGVLNLLLQVV